MLCLDRDRPLSDHDVSVYRSVIPCDHFLLAALEAIDWEGFRKQLAPFYCADLGRPAESPVLMLKLEYLRYHYNLPDREVISRSTTDLAFRYFLQLPLRGGLPDPSLLCLFRARLGKQGFRDVFNGVVAAAREHGFVKDRLRIKDATHVIGNLKVPTAIALVAQSRDKLLATAERFAPQMVQGELINLEMLRETTKDLKPAQRLLTRMSHLHEILFWCDSIEAPADSQRNRFWQDFLTQRDLAHKILDDQEHPDQGDRTLSTTDPDARRSMHGGYFDGYFVDILVDADSEIVTQINVLAGGGGEAADAAELIRCEEAAHGNDIEAVSIDGAGFSGPALRELQDPDGLNVDTYVPVPKEPDSGLFTPRQFSANDDGTVTCPAGQTSSTKFYDKQKHATKYEFSAATCRACPLLNQCMKKAPSDRKGRTVSKSDYQAEHERARAKATTDEHAAIRQIHPKVERKLGEMMNRHGGRQARYRGHTNVFIQELMVTMATNVKRIVMLLAAPAPASA